MPPPSRDRRFNFFSSSCIVQGLLLSNLTSRMIFEYLRLFISLYVVLRAYVSGNRGIAIFKTSQAPIDTKHS